MPVDGAQPSVNIGYSTNTLLRVLFKNFMLWLSHTPTRYAVNLNIIS